MSYNVRIKNKNALRKIIHENNFQKIAIWKNGLWARVEAGYAGEKNGNNPIVFINYPNFNNKTFKEIDIEIGKIEKSIASAINKR